MAFTSAPEKQTNSSERIPCFFPINTRIGAVTPLSLDAVTSNLVPKKQQKGDGSQETYLETRLPIQAVKVAATTEVPRGCYVWEKTSGVFYYFAVCGQNIYTSTTAASGSWTAVTTFTTASTTPVGFTEFINSATNTKSLIIVDGVEGYVFTSNAAGTKIVDVDFPSPHLPYPIYIDGYLFLAKADTGDIYNSNLNDPTAWTAGDFISSELYPDDITALAKVNNYLLAIGKLGCEYFYDAANATGTPLARYEGGSLPFGAAIPTSMAVNKNTVVFLANNNDGEYCLKIIEDFKNKEISIGFITAALNTAFATGLSTPANVRGFFLRQAGELMYVLKTGSSAVSTAYAYCFTTQSWISLSTESGFGFNVNHSAFGSSTNVVTFVQGKTNTGAFPFFGKMGQSPLNSGLFDDSTRDWFDGSNTTYRYNVITYFITPNLDFDTLNRKTMSRFGVICTLASYSSTETIQVSWTDDDYNSYTTPVDLTLRSATVGIQDYPFITQLGKFRQRAFKVQYSGLWFIRFKYLEMDINKGQQ